MTMEDLDSEPGYKHSDDLEDLLSSAERCAVCHLIGQEIHKSLNSGRPYEKPAMSTRHPGRVREYHG